MEIKSVGSQEIMQLMEDVALIKKVLFIKKEDPEGELTEWAKKQLRAARKTPNSRYISHEEVKKRIFSKK